jgi:hypothetical protein
MMKTLTTLATAGMIAAAAVTAPAPAQADSNGGAIAAGVVGGLAAGAIIGSAWRPYPAYGYAYSPGYAYAPGPVYYGDAYAYSRRCHIVRQRIWTDYGPRWRQTRVCD